MFRRSFQLTNFYDWTYFKAYRALFVENFPKKITHSYQKFSFGKDWEFCTLLPVEIQIEDNQVMYGFPAVDESDCRNKEFQVFHRTNLRLSFVRLRCGGLC